MASDLAITDESSAAQFNRARPHQAQSANQIWNPPSVDDPILGFFMDYWNEKRKNRSTCSRAEIGMRDIRKHIGHIVIVDVGNGGDTFTFKLIGNEVAEYSFPYQTGKTVSASYVGEFEEFGQKLIGIYRRVAQEKIPVRVQLTGVPWLRGLLMDFDALHLPLSDDDCNVDSILSVLNYKFSASDAEA